jgi:hypothetical protein
MTASGGAGTTLPSANSSTFPDVLDTPASLIGSELSVYLAPAFIMLVLLAALYWAIIHQRGLRFAPPLRCAGPRVVRTYLSTVGRAHHANLYLQHLCARPTGFYHGVGAFSLLGPGPLS